MASGGLRRAGRWAAVGLAAAAILAAACGNEEPPGTAASRVERILAECAKVSACTGEAASACFRTVANKDSWDPFDGVMRARAIELRAGCMAAAEDCDAVLACIAAGEQAFADEQEALAAQAACEPEEYSYCEDGLLVWCFLDEYDTEATPVPADIAAMGLTCNSAGTYAADPGHPTCDWADFEGRCDGAGVALCASGERSTWDCRDIDAEFVCTVEPDEPSRPLCTLPQAAQECEPGYSSDEGEWGECAGDVARICAGRKIYEVDCSAFQGGSCVEEHFGEWPEAFCRL